MSFIKYLIRIKYIDCLIRKGATGDLMTLSKKLKLSKSAVSYILKEMKEVGFPIKYSKDRSSYYYEEKGKMTEQFFLKDMADEELRKITGGKNSFQICLKSNNTGTWCNNFVE